MMVKRWTDGALSIHIGKRAQIVYEPRAKTWHPMDAHVIPLFRGAHIWWTR